MKPIDSSVGVALHDANSTHTHFVKIFQVENLLVSGSLSREHDESLPSLFYEAASGGDEIRLYTQPLTFLINAFSSFLNEEKCKELYQKQ